MFSISGIPAHIDTHSAFEDEIISLSLGSEVSAEAFFFSFFLFLNQLLAYFTLHSALFPHVGISILIKMNSNF